MHKQADAACLSRKYAERASNQRRFGEPVQQLQTPSFDESATETEPPKRRLFSCVSASSTFSSTEVPHRRLSLPSAANDVRRPPAFVTEERRVRAVS
eukprot:1225216-Prymnesium_polylepis.1